MTTLQASLWGGGFINLTNQASYSIAAQPPGPTRGQSFGYSRFAYVIEQTPPKPVVYLGTTSDYSQYWGPG